MEIKLKNSELIPAINFLQSMELLPKESRSRSKLVTLLVQGVENLKQEEGALAARFDLLNAQGNLKKEEECDFFNVQSFNLEQNILLNEEVIISGGMYSKNIEEIPRILSEYNKIISGKEAEIYDRLLDEFERGTL